MGKFLSNNLRNSFPNWVLRDLLKGGLYQSMFFRFLFLFDLLSLAVVSGVADGGGVVVVGAEGW